MGKSDRPGAVPPRGSSAGNGLRFGVANIAALLAAVACIVLGYLLLAHGSITAAPLLLVLGYVVLIPVGLLIGFRRQGE